MEQLKNAEIVYCNERGDEVTLAGVIDAKLEERTRG